MAIVSRRKVDTSQERAILIGAIVSDRFLRDVIPMYQPSLFEISYSNIIMGWCIRHFKRYEKAPQKLIQDVFAQWKKTNKSDDQVEFIEGFLATLSDEFEHASRFNAEYLLDKAIAHFKTRSLKVLSEDISDSLNHNDLDSAEGALNDYKKVEQISDTSISVLDDETSWKEAFEEASEPLFKLPAGPLNDMIGDQFTRDSFVALMGMAKSGKSFSLMFLAHCAVKSRCNVASFQVGDLSKNQTMMREGIYLTGRSNKEKYNRTLHQPELDCEHNQDNSCTKRSRSCRVGCLAEDETLLPPSEAVGYVSCSNCQSSIGGDFKGAVWLNTRRPVRLLDWQSAFKAAQDFKKKYKAQRYKLSVHPARSMNISMIEAQLDTWERLEGWIPDVILIDYADILAPERKGNKETRDDVNEGWTAMRALSQKRHCCVITATQASGAAIKQKTVSREHYSSDRRKFDHVTAMYGLSQTPEEKRLGIVRWGGLVVRESDWDAEYQVSVIGHLAAGNPYVGSF